LFAELLYPTKLHCERLSASAAFEVTFTLDSSPTRVAMVIAPSSDIHRNSIAFLAKNEMALAMDMFSGLSGDARAVEVVFNDANSLGTN
jgi:hypothetical protein